MCLSATLSRKELEFISSFGINNVGTVGLEEAEKRGWISNFIIYNIAVPLEPEDLERKEELDDLHKKYFRKFNSDFFLAMGCFTGKTKYYKHLQWNVSKTGNQWREFHAEQMGWTINMGFDHQWSPKSIGRYAGIWFNYMTKRKKFLHESEHKLNMAEEVISHLNLKTILFSENIAIADKLEQRFGKLARSYHSGITTKLFNENKIIGEGVKDRKYSVNGIQETLTFKQVKHLYPLVERIGGNKLKHKIKEDFINNKFKILLTAKALDEGFDCVDVECGVVHSGSSVKRVNTQRMGRVLRSSPDKMAVIVNIYVKDSQDEKWVVSRQLGTPKSKIHWITDVSEIKIEKEEVLNLT